MFEEGRKRMNKQGQMNVGAFVMLFIGIVVIVGAFIPQIFNTQNLMTDKQDVSNQSQSTVTAFVGDNEVNESIEYTIYSDQSTWKETECPLSSVVIRNGAGTELVDDTDYTLAESTGVYTLLNTSDTVPDTALNLTYVDYTYCADGYNTSTGGRSTAALIGIFAALAILAWVLDKSGVISFTN